MKDRVSAKSFHDSHIFTGVQARMLNIAEKAGQVDSIMDDIANQLEGEIDEKISSYINILEPATCYYTFYYCWSYLIICHVATFRNYVKYIGRYFL